MGLPKFGNIYRLTRDPELTTSNSGISICRVGLACSEKYGEKETQLFLDATAFKKTAEMLSTVQKGHRVFVHGKLETQTWQDQQSGQNRSKVCMIIESFEFIEPKQQGQQNQAQSQPQGQYQPQPINQYQQNQQGWGQGTKGDDDIPF